MESRSIEAGHDGIDNYSSRDDLEPVEPHGTMGEGATDIHSTSQVVPLLGTLPASFVAPLHPLVASFPPNPRPDTPNSSFSGGR